MKNIFKQNLENESPSFPVRNPHLILHIVRGTPNNHHLILYKSESLQVKSH